VKPILVSCLYTADACTMSFHLTPVRALGGRLAPADLVGLARWLVLGGPPPLPGAPALAPGALPPGLRARAAHDAMAAVEEALAVSCRPSGKLLSGSGGGAAAAADGSPAAPAADGNAGPDGRGATDLANSMQAGGHSAGDGDMDPGLRPLLAALQREAGRLGVLGEVRARAGLAPAELAAVEAALAVGPGLAPHDPARGAALSAANAAQGGQAARAAGAAGGEAAGGGAAEAADGAADDPQGPLTECVRGLAARGCGVHKLLAVADAALGGGAGGDSHDGASVGEAARSFVARAVADVFRTALSAHGAGGEGAAAAGSALDGAVACLAGPGVPADQGAPPANGAVQRPRNGLRRADDGAATVDDAAARGCAGDVAAMRNAAWAELHAFAAARAGGAAAADAPALRLLDQLWPDEHSGHAGRHGAPAGPSLARAACLRALSRHC